VPHRLQIRFIYALDLLRLGIPFSIFSIAYFDVSNLIRTFQVFRKIEQEMSEAE
jgi:hypothetical protein